VMVAIVQNLLDMIVIILGVRKLEIGTHQNHYVSIVFS
jgi:hypothetical protein